MEQQISLEEQGNKIKFGDMMESCWGGEFRLLPHWHNSQVEPAWVQHTVRYTPFNQTFRAREYVRSLFLGRLHRLHQVSPNNSVVMTRGILELAHELRRKPLGFPWRVLRQASYGIHIPAAQVLLRVFRLTAPALTRNSSRTRWTCRRFSRAANRGSPKHTQGGLRRPTGAASSQAGS